MLQRVKFLIIGAGPTGLGAGYRLRELNENDFLIVDAADDVGGLARSFVDPQGFTWDIGGHVQFSHYDYFDVVMNRALAEREWNFHERESWVWMRQKFIPYPFQYNIRHLPAEELVSCLHGLIDAQNGDSLLSPDNFAAWIIGTFGQGLADTFFRPYNEKVWAFPLEQLSSEWVGDRVAVVDLKRLLRNIILAEDETSWGPNNKFRFPKRGGTGAIWQGVANLVGRSHIQLSSNVVSVDAAKKLATLADGQSIQYDHLLSTMPLDLLVQCITQSTARLATIASQLKFSSTNVVGIGLEGPMPETLSKKCWMYFPEDDNPFYRVTVFSNYARDNVATPDKQWSLQIEVSESPSKFVAQETLLDDVIDGLYATRLILPKSEIVSRWVYRAEHGYPTPFLNRNTILNEIHRCLADLGIFSRGRFGGWKYEVSNQDHSFMQGVEWVNSQVQGAPEPTYFSPDVVNQPRKS